MPKNGKKIGTNSKDILALHSRANNGNSTNSQDPQTTTSITEKSTTESNQLGLPSHTNSMGTGMSNGGGLINKSIDPTLGGKNNKGNHKTNSPKPKESPNLRKSFHNSKPLEDQTSLLTPKSGFQRMLKSRLANIDAIPDVSPVSNIEGGGGGPAATPAITSAVEILTQAGLVLITQAKDELITNQQ